MEQKPLVGFTHKNLVPSFCSFFPRARNYDTQEKHFNSNKRLHDGDWMRTEERDESVDVHQHCTRRWNINSESLPLSDSDSKHTQKKTFMLNGFDDKWDDVMQMQRILRDIKKPAFLCPREMRYYDSENAGAQKSSIFLISCGQQPKIIKTCAAAVTQRVWVFMHDVMHETFSRRVYLQLQFKCSHVLLIDLIEIYMWMDSKGSMAFVMLIEASFKRQRSVSCKGF